MASLDTESPCARYRRLLKVKEDLVTGEAVVETRFGEDSIKFAKADIGSLDKMIAEAQVACNKAMGVKTQRKRYAMGVRFRG